jgi:hypothetical protein
LASLSKILLIIIMIIMGRECQRGTVWGIRRRGKERVLGGEKV